MAFAETQKKNTRRKIKQSGCTKSIAHMGFYQLKRTQMVHQPVDVLWDFISSPANLKRITPAHMGFDITTEHLPTRMYEGMIVSYKVSPLLGIPMTWVTEITHISEGEYFVDEQRSGPYSMWHHEHWLQPVAGGTLMTDLVSYQPPLGILGSIANSVLIRHQLRSIFDYREQALIRIFPE